jgi:hypothetical protein
MNAGITATMRRKCHIERQCRQRRHSDPGFLATKRRLNHANILKRCADRLRSARPGFARWMCLSGWTGIDDLDQANGEASVYMGATDLTADGTVITTDNETPVRK